MFLMTIAKEEEEKNRQAGRSVARGVCGQW